MSATSRNSGLAGLRKFLVVILGGLLAWVVMHGLPALLAKGSVVQTGTFSFQRTPPGWEAGLADLERAAGLKCTRVSQRDNDALVLDCSLVRSRSSPDIFGLLAGRLGLGSGIAVADVRASPAVTPSFPWLNHTAFWWLPLPFIAVLLAGHRWREDLYAGGRWVKHHSLTLLACTSALLLLPRLTRMAYGHPFLDSPTELGWYVLAPVLLGPVLEELLFRGVLYRWFRAAGLSVWGNAVLSSLLFVLWHYSQLAPSRILVLFASGLIFFWVRHRSGSIFLAVLVHALVNLGAVRF